MPTRVWAHLCEFATTIGGRAFIIGESDTIAIGEVPSTLPLLHTIAKWNGHSGEQFHLRIRITAPSGKQLIFSPALRITIPLTPKGEGNHVNTVAITNMELPEFGEYSIEFVVDNNPVYVLPLYLVQG